MATARLAKPKRKRPRKPPKPPQPLAPETTPSEPDGRLVLLPNRISGVRVDEDTALTLGAVFACVRLIAEDIAGLPWNVMEHRAGNGSDPRPEDPANWLLHTQANPETPAFQWRETTIAHALTWGNGYSEIERDGAGRPVWLWQLTPDRVEVARTNDGRIVYDVYNPREPNTVLEKEDVFHLRGLGFDGLVGYSIIRMAARAIGIGIATEDASSTLFANDTTPGGILKAKTKLKPEAVDNLRKSWQARHGGPTKRRTVAILEEGLEWQQTGLPPGDAQLIEQRQITPSDIARWFRVSPPKIGDLSRATFSNVEELSIWHVTDTLMPWIRRLETEGNIKLFRATNRGKRFTKINMNALLRGKLADRQSYLTAMLDRGVLDINETRDLEDLNPIGSDGDKRFVQANMQLLENAGELPPEPPPAEPNQDMPANPPADAPANMPDDGMMRGKLPNLLSPLVVDACGRILRREANGMARLKKDDPDKLAEFRADHETYIRQTLTPLAIVMLKDEAAERVALNSFVEMYWQGETRAAEELADRFVRVCMASNDMVTVGEST